MKGIEMLKRRRQRCAEAYAFLQKEAYIHGLRSGGILGNEVGFCGVAAIPIVIAGNAKKADKC
jgi:hypothetical protein